MEEEAPEKEKVSIWFWVGLVLSTYGVLVLGTALYHLAQPPTTVLGNLRPGIWWGALMLAMGALFLYVDRQALTSILRRDSSPK